MHMVYLAYLVCKILVFFIKNINTGKNVNKICYFFVPAEILFSMYRFLWVVELFLVLILFFVFTIINNPVT